MAQLDFIRHLNIQSSKSNMNMNKTPAWQIDRGRCGACDGWHRTADPAIPRK
jgi:hypothetical protein